MYTNESPGGEHQDLQSFLLDARAKPCSKNKRRKKIRTKFLK
ncbi:hypothetical protein THTE_2722 [Thermogutta terrifontis]|uniref:Uncharacterized protein n=1 Tax=Thermogutta terrifontis TaxID=1331910 RepID=A0A286RH74_9BACT|nr:hypothetical protein THTE_2722 [Thermogutta terrifontis]